MLELADLFAFDVPPWEMAVRGTAIYWFLLLVFRFILRRDAGSMGIVDLLFVVLVADAASNGMSGDYKTIGDGIVLLSTLVFWNYVLDWASFHFAWIDKLLEPRPEVLVRHGKVVWKTLRKELMTREELVGKLRQQGVENFSEVRVAYLEADGEISVLRWDKAAPPNPPTSRPPGAA